GWALPASAQPIQSSTPRRAACRAAAVRSEGPTPARCAASVLVSVTASVLRFWSTEASLRLDAGVLDDLGPARHVGLDPRIRLRGRAADRRVAELAQPRDHGRRLQR